MFHNMNKIIIGQLLNKIENLIFIFSLNNICKKNAIH